MTLILLDEMRPLSSAALLSLRRHASVESCTRAQRRVGAGTSHPRGAIVVGGTSASSSVNRLRASTRQPVCEPTPAEPATALPRVAVEAEVGCGSGSQGGGGGSAASPLNHLFFAGTRQKAHWHARRNGHLAAESRARAAPPVGRQEAQLREEAARYYLERLEMASRMASGSEGAAVEGEGAREGAGEGAWEGARPQRSFSE